MIRVGIVGCSGYTAIEAIRWLMHHPQAEIVAATSRQADGSCISQMHPELTERLSLEVEDLSPEQIAERCDIAFCCLPHAASAPIVAKILQAGKKVVDLSADYRLSSADLYEQWYGGTHPDPERLGTTPYGLPELFEEQISGATLVANPGCYPTSAILPLAPLLKAELIEAEPIVVDSKSGVSGAGRTPKMVNLYSEANESFMAYGVGTHRHQPEIIDILHRSTGAQVDLVFTPHLVPMDRGILSTIYVKVKGEHSANDLQTCLIDFYKTQPFVRVVDHLPATRNVTRTNFCDIAVRQHGSWMVLVSAIDNLTKGASGAAIQCMNVMYGLDQTLGLVDQ
ncbi:MAG: N-acetyl-gamma-glutamyl-phosphate reductase [Planctomycetota bacterium]|nr:N-acetyl-gamma-glutamyl-phosphate reductase [Planctomycetota bacterium]